MAKPPVKSRWVKGQSGNPSGAGKVPTDIKLLARTYTTQAMNALVKALKNPKTCVQAAVALHDRGWGKPTQPVEGLGLDKLVEVLERRRQRASGPAEGG
jgi:hypothetical protein